MRVLNSSRKQQNNGNEHHFNVGYLKITVILLVLFELLSFLFYHDLLVSSYLFHFCLRVVKSNFQKKYIALLALISILYKNSHFITMSMIYIFLFPTLNKLILILLLILIIIPGRLSARESCVLSVGRTLKPWVATFLRGENSNIKLGAGEYLALVGNYLDMVSR